MKKQDAPTAAQEKLRELRGQLARAKANHPQQRQLAEAVRGQIKGLEAEISSVLDAIVEENRKAAVAIIPTGPEQAVRRFAELAAKAGVPTIDVGSAYRDLCAELAIRAGVAKRESSGSLVSVDRSPQQLTSDQVHFLVAGSQPAWFARSHYAAKGARSFNQPAPPRINDLWYSNLGELIRRVKFQYAVTNKTHEIGKVSVLEVLREQAACVPPVGASAVVLVGFDFEEEKTELASLFGGRTEVQVPADVSRKQAAALLEQRLSEKTQ